jgi:hypothetical protein
MIQRGRILRDTNAGPGLLSLDGRQYSFVLEGMWRSEAPPKTGMVVEVVLNSADSVESVRSVPENELAKEQAQKALREGGAIASRVKETLGLPNLIALGSLVVGWFFLSTIVIGREAFSAHITFWQLLGYMGKLQALRSLNMQDLASTGIGMYGLLALVSLAGPFLDFLWKDRRAALGGLLPLVLMLLIAILLKTGLNQAAHQFAGAYGTGPVANMMANQAIASFLDEFSMGAGAYISLLATGYFAFVAVKKYLVASA